MWLLQAGLYFLLQMGLFSAVDLVRQEAAENISMDIATGHWWIVSNFLDKC